MNTTIKKTLITAGLSALALTLLTACGGGDNSNDKSASQTNQANQVTVISDKNQDQIASMSLRSIDTAIGFAANGTNIAADNTVLSPTIAPSNEMQAPIQVSIPTSTSSKKCTSGGTLNLAWYSQRNSSDTPGDTTDAIYTTCTESGITRNGTLSLTLLSPSGDPLNNKSRMAFKDFATTRQGITVTQNGSLELVQTRADNLTTRIINNGNLSSTTTQGTTAEQLAMNNLKLTTTSTLESSSIQLEMQLINKTITGESGFQIKTTTPLTQNASGDMPAGQFTITSQDSTLSIEFLGGNAVRLSLDSNNDGVMESSKTTTLAALRRI